MARTSIGERELALLRHIADRDGSTVGEVAESFGAERQLARSTVLTMMERLRKKGYLTRRLVGGVYRYRARSSSSELLRSAVGRFIERHLGGSVAPFAAYLSDAEGLSDAELEELTEVVSRLRATRHKEPS